MPSGSWAVVTTTDPPQKTQAPGLRGWGWETKDGSRDPSPFFGQAVGLRLAPGAQHGQEMGGREKEAKAVSSLKGRTSYRICRSPCKMEMYEERQAGVSSDAPRAGPPSSRSPVCPGHAPVEPAGLAPPHPGTLTLGKQVARICRLCSSVHSSGNVPGMPQLESCKCKLVTWSLKGS